MAVPVEIVHRRAERAGARQDDVLPELDPVAPLKPRKATDVVAVHANDQVGVAIGVEIREVGVSGAGDA